MWEGTSTAKFHCVTDLHTNAKNGQVVVQFNYRCSENGDGYSTAMTLVVRSQPTGSGIEWATET